MLLYQQTIPNSIKTDLSEKTILVNGTWRIYFVTKPTITMYAPEKPNGISVIICPGGGYIRLSIDNEGVAVAKALNTLGITAFVLKYRLPNDTIMFDRSIGPLQDAQQAIRMVRQHAAQWGLKENKIGIMGFSAGGHLAATAATHFNFIANGTLKDSISLKPDFAILLYPVISFAEGIMHKGSKIKLLGETPSQEKIIFFSNELQVTKNCPPVFIVHAGDDPTVPVENSIRFYQACIEKNVPAEMHLYPKGGHGFGLYNTTTEDKWMDRLSNWIKGLQ
ncbi:alpha/beta hydrolase [Ferruginibacter lapsinanis]|uniref:alpha/beta hydrolase n=1 Tax=Ferruginibacter lapsinanis TaxID=563172 RepID=UPI001E5D3873|nr:alpha/beta hydrolase [Ferruginibacter lapsinanis]UEG49804.1 alpha/beta hydrolase [Ferruginibacter lapsinanis]